MSDVSVAIKDAGNNTKNFLAQTNPDTSLSFYHVEDLVQRAALLAAFNPLATAALQTAANTILTSIANNTSGSATAANQATGNTSLASIVTNTNGLAKETTQAAGNASLATIATNTTNIATAANQTAANTALNNIATNTAKPAATSATGSLTATGVGTQTGVTIRGDFNVTIYGTFVATVAIERSFDGGTTWFPLTALGTSISLNGPSSEVFSEPEAGVKYRVNCTSFTSGTINYRISQ